MIRARELVLHPIAIASIALLLVNDHWLKQAHPSALTGKLSDFAGLTFFPLLVLIVLDRMWPARRALTVRLAAAFTAIGFALVKVLPAATELYRHGLGFVQSPWSPSPVEAVTDPTDLIALPCVALAIVIAYRSAFVPRTPANQALVCEPRIPRTVCVTPLMISASAMKTRNSG